MRLKWGSAIFFSGLLIFSSFCSAIRVEVGSIGISFTHLLMPILLAYVIAKQRKGTNQYPVQIDNSSMMLYAIWVVSMVSTILYSGLPTRSITGAINFTSFIFLFAMCRWIFSFIDANRLIATLTNSALVSSSIGFFFLLLALLTSEGNIGATFDHINQFNIASIDKPIPSIRSFAIEPNLFGIVTASVFAIYLAIYLTWDKSSKIIWPIALLGITLILSYTRSAFMGVIFSVFIMAFISKQWKVLARVFQYGLAFVVVISLLILILPDESSFKQAISYKLGLGMIDVSSGTAIPRLVALQESINGFVKSPLIGNGIFSANNIFINPHTFEVTGTAGPIGWLNGLFIQSLHDTGILGLLSWVCFFFFLLHFNYRIFKKLPPSFERSVVLGFIGGNIILLVGSQASSVVWIAFPFVYWAINLSILRQYRSQFITNNNENRN